MRLIGVCVPECFEDARGVVAAAHGHAAGARDLEDLVAGFAEDLEEAFDFGGGAGHLQHDGLGCEVDDAGAEDGGELEDLRARVDAVRLVGAGGDLDEAELADDGFGAVDLVDVDGGFELVERCADAIAACSWASQTMVMREVSGRSDSPTVSETMLMLSRRKSEATRVSTPGLS